MVRNITKEDLLGTCGDAVKAMKHVEIILEELGLTADANVLERARERLNKDILYFFEDTQPIEIPIASY